MMSARPTSGVSRAEPAEGEASAARHCWALLVLLERRQFTHGKNVQ